MSEGMQRRDFLKVIGVAGGGAALVGCSGGEAEKLIPYVVPPEDIMPGTATWYRTTCRECPAGCGMEVRTREGRALKAEGNPLSPVSHGRLCARGQASVQGLYNPDRVPQPLQRASVDDDWSKLSWDAAERSLAEALSQNRGRAVFLTGTFTGTMDTLVDDFCAAHGVERVRFDTFAHEAIRAGNRAVFGVDAVPVHDFENADVVVTFGADFLETWLSPVDYAHGFVQAHALSGGKRGHLIAVGPHQSLTDQNADEWLAIKPGTEHLVALAMARSISDRPGGGSGATGGAAAAIRDVDVNQVAELAGIPADRIHSAARQFANGGRSLAVGPGVASSHRAAAAVAAAVGVLNSVAGNVGKTVRFARQESGAKAGSYADLQRLVTRMKGGEIGLLMVHGPNPLHGVPLGEDAVSAFDQVPLVVSFSSYPDETAERANLLMPDHHFLESWGDVEPRTGVHSLVQPVMTPVFRTKQTGDVLLSVARRTGASLPNAANSYYDYLRGRWQREVMPGSGIGGDAESAWREALRRGVVVGRESGEPSRSAGAAGLADVRFDAPEFVGEGDFHLVVYPSYRFYDGRMANRPWLQELPDPVSKISWGSWVEMSPKSAERLGLDTGHVVEVETPYGKAELPVFIYPGVRDDTIAVQLGQGHTALGRYARSGDEPRGVDAARLLGPEADPQTGGLVWQQSRARVTPTGDWAHMPMTGHLTQGGREIALTTTAAEAARNGRAVDMAAVPTGAEGEEEAAQPMHAAAAGNGQGEAVAARVESTHGGAGAGEHGEEPEVHPMEQVVTELQAAGGFAPLTYEAGPQEYPPPGTYYGEYSEEHPRWGMAIDMERCIGCSACETACYAENNIAVVGPEQIARGRIMHWMRIERYFEQDENGQTESTTFLPMLCQQCGNAPCEPVCPVYASYHTPDGLNGQVYNRCVGTRYCANNCPYKVRYFNYFTAEWPEPLNWQLNPDVTVREKGVMEKCTFCVQRIRDKERHARLEDRALLDGEIVPACAQTCPGDAIVFGNLKDPNARVTRIAASGRGYRVLGELNTQSAITYLKKVVAEGSEA